MYKLIYSLEADRDLTEIFQYIARDSVSRASNYMVRMGKAIATLSEFPNVGHDPTYPEIKGLGIKIFVFEHYLAFYRIDEQNKEVQIIRVRNGVTNYKGIFRGILTEKEKR